MVTGFEVVGATGVALGCIGMIHSLGMRILDKPKDTKAIRQLSTDAQSYITQLRQWETTMTGDSRQACIELRQSLEAISNEIDNIKGERRLARMMTCLKFYKPEFREKFADALQKFMFRMHGGMEVKVSEMTASMRNLRIASEALQAESGMEQHVAGIREKLAALSQDIKTWTTAASLLHSELES